MVKRTLHNRSFFQCDLTGLPLAHSGCYLPLVDADGKVHKKGQYATWECVMQVLFNTVDDTNALKRSLAHIQKHLRGALPNGALVDVDLLEHFGGYLTASEWHVGIVMADVAGVPAVRVMLDGTLEPWSVPAYASGPNIKGVQAKRHTGLWFDGRELVVIWDASCAEPNPKACEIAKTDGLTGDVTLVLCVPDVECFMTRNRYVPCTIADLEAPPPSVAPKPSRKRKKAASPKAVPTEEAATLAEFKLAKRRMTTGFKEYEAEMSKDAVAPNTIVPGAVMPPPSGAALAAVARLQGLGGGSPRSSAPRAPA